MNHSLKLYRFTSCPSPAPPAGCCSWISLPPLTSSPLELKKKQSSIGSGCRSATTLSVLCVLRVCACYVGCVWGASHGSKSSSAVPSSSFILLELLLTLLGHCDTPAYETDITAFSVCTGDSRVLIPSVRYYQHILSTVWSNGERGLSV
jgi:hypothetical protein